MFPSVVLQGFLTLTPTLYAFLSNFLFAWGIKRRMHQPTDDLHEIGVVQNQNCHRTSSKSEHGHPVLFSLSCHLGAPFSCLNASSLDAFVVTRKDSEGPQVADTKRWMVSEYGPTAEISRRPSPCRVWRSSTSKRETHQGQLRSWGSIGPRSQCSWMLHMVTCFVPSA